MNRQLSFFEELTEQRWDDHRFYHQSYVNQALHLFSASCFVVTYVLIPIEPVAAVFFGWFIAMWSRQIGHFFFEPKGHDNVNGVSFAHKEKIKVGFNLQRKVAMLIAWLSIPAILHFVPSTLAWMTSLTGEADYLHNLAVAWLSLAGIGLLGRTIWLMIFRNPQTGLVWCTKILTDPFHDIKQYHAAPLHLLRGERLDPMNARASHG
ncbi:MAG: DUF962 domain-containing protein [Deltaproteobacteria bacterium]|jgi:hypothetical protein